MNDGGNLVPDRLIHVENALRKDKVAFLNAAEADLFFANNKLNYDFPNPAPSGPVKVGRSHYVDKPDPECGYESTQCVDITVVLPPTSTATNLYVNVDQVRYYYLDLPIYSGQWKGPLDIDPKFNCIPMAWAKISPARIYETTDGLWRRVAVSAQLMNWSDAYERYAMIDVRWSYGGVK